MGAFTRLPRVPSVPLMRFGAALVLSAGVGALALPTAASATAITVQAELISGASTKLIPATPTSDGAGNEINNTFTFAGYSGTLVGYLDDSTANVWTLHLTVDLRGATTPITVLLSAAGVPSAAGYFVGTDTENWTKVGTSAAYSAYYTPGGALFSEGNQLYSDSFTSTSITHLSNSYTYNGGYVEIPSDYAMTEKFVITPADKGLPHVTADLFFVPEPASALLLLAGIGGMLLIVRRRAAA